MSETNEQKSEEALKLKVFKDVLSDTQKELDEKNSELEQAKNKNESLTNELTQTQERFDTQRKDFSDAQEKLLYTTEELSQTQKKINSLIKELSPIREELNSTKEELSQSGTKLSELNGKIISHESTIKELNSQIEELKGTVLQKEEENKKLSEINGQNENVVNEQATQLKELSKELNLLKPQERTDDYKSEERKICAKCGAVGADIKVEEDRMTILSYMGNRPMYAKKNICKKCGFSF